MKIKFEAIGRLSKGGNFVVFQNHFGHMKYASASLPTSEVKKQLRNRKAKVIVEIDDE